MARINLRQYRGTIMTHYDFIIIGAGSAGRTAAETLIEESDGRSILLINGESVLPYKRTKVSKNVEKGYERDDFAVHPLIWYSENGVDILNSRSVSQLNPEAHTIALESNTISFSTLLLATGARPNLPFENLPSERWSTIWTAEDGLTLHNQLSGLKRVAVVGVGVLGVEAAWQTFSMGLDTVLVGRDNRPMMKYLDHETTDTLESAIRDSGVSLILEQDVKNIVENRKRDGIKIEIENKSLEVDYAILATGAFSEISLARTSGLQVGRGIKVDSSLKTSVPDIWAAGDCAEHPDGLVTGLWHSAENQGRLAALGMLGRNEVNNNPPYRLKCEVFGGFWFSAGPVNGIEGVDGLGPAESWVSRGILWRPRFRNNELASLAAAAPGGMDQNEAKSAQNLLLERADRERARAVLMKKEN